MSENSNLHNAAISKLQITKYLAKDHKKALLRAKKDLDTKGFSECLKAIRERTQQYTEFYYWNLVLELLPEISNIFEEMTKACIFLERTKEHARRMLIKFAELGGRGTLNNSDTYEMARDASDMLFRIETKCDNLLYQYFQEMDNLKKKVEIGVDLLSDPDPTEARTSEKYARIPKNKMDGLSKEIVDVCLKYIADIEDIDENDTEKKLDNVQTPID